MPALVRHTRQRQAIQDALAAAGRPLSPQELLDAARAALPRLGLATVYRTLRVLVEIGAVRAVELPGAAPRYEIAGKQHHHHFHCRSCDGLYEVDACPGGIRGLLPGGFTLERHEIILYGVCSGCGGDT